MKNPGLIDTLQQASVERMNSFQQALTAVNSAADSLRTSCIENASSFRKDMEVSLKKSQMELELLVETERQSIRQAREALIALKEKDWEEVTTLRKRFWKWGALWSMGVTLLGGFMTISVLWILPFKALPMSLQARMEQLAAVETAIIKTELKLAAEREQLDRMTSMDADLTYVKTRLTHTEGDPNGLWIRTSQPPITSPISDREVWIQIR